MNSVTPSERSVFPRPGTETARGPPWKFSWYVLWRVVGAIVIVFLVLTAVFVAVEVLPGSPTDLVPRNGCGTGGIGSPYCDLRAQVIAQWGLDQPLLDRYGIFLGNILTGNLGISTTVRPGVPVWSLIAPVLWNSVALIGVTLILVAAISIPLGSFLRRRRGSLLDAVASALLALPFAATAPILALLTAYALLLLGWFPLFPTDAFGLPYYAIPLLILVGTTLGLYTWMVRDAPMDPAGPERAPGEWRTPKPSARVRTRTGIARFLSALPALVAWTVAAELLFEAMWPYNGAGLLLWDGLRRSDTFVTMGVLLTFGLLVILPTIIATDILHEWLTFGWRREDGRTAEAFRVRIEDLRMGVKAVFGSATGFAGIILLLIIVGMAVAAPLIAGPYQIGLRFGTPNLPPSSGHLLGTDEAGRDILNLLLYGAQPAVIVALTAFALALLAGLALLSILGLLGPRAAVFVSIPLDAALVLSVPFAGYLGYLFLRGGNPWLMAVFAWPAATKILQIETRGLVQPGDPSIPRPTAGKRIINLIWGMGPLLLGNAFLAVSFAEAIEGGLGWLGVGAGSATNIMSWSSMLNNAYNNLAILRGQFWYFDSPALAILGAVLAPLLLSLAVKRELWTRKRSPRPPSPTEAPSAVNETASPPG